MLINVDGGVVVGVQLTDGFCDAFGVDAAESSQFFHGAVRNKMIG